MLPHRECSSTLKVFCTVVIVVVTATLDLEKQPVGPEMCKYHCSKFPGCTFCIFLMRRLACIATMSKYPPQTNGTEAVYLDFTKERPISQRKDSCKDRLSKLVVTRSNEFRCVKMRTEDNTQLLVVPWKNRTMTPLVAVNLLNSSTTTHHHIKPKDATALAYVPSSRQVLVGMYKQKKIQAFSLHTNVSVTLRRRIYVLSIAVDDVQQLVFLATRSPYMCVTSMTPDGRYFKKITCQFLSYMLCLDTRREIIYFAGPSFINSFTYTGQKGQWIRSSGSVNGLSLGENGDVMYYVEDSNIMELKWFQNKTVRKLGSVHFTAGGMLFNKGYLYMSSAGNRYIHVWHDSNYSVLRGGNPTGVTHQVIALMP